MKTSIFLLIVRSSNQCFSGGQQRNSVSVFKTHCIKHQLQSRLSTKSETKELEVGGLGIRRLPICSIWIAWVGHWEAVSVRRRGKSRRLGSCGCTAVRVRIRSIVRHCPHAHCIGHWSGIHERPRSDSLSQKSATERSCRRSKHAWKIIPHFHSKLFSGTVPRLVAGLN